MQQYTLIAVVILTAIAHDLCGEPAILAAVSRPADQANKTDYPCYFTAAPIAIDGKADEAAWKHAAAIDNFAMPWVREGNQRPATATRAKLLWDRQHLYFYADMDDTDLYADIKQHDGQTWNNDVFELFFKPAADKPGYYEFQVTPNNTKLDAFFPRRGSGGIDRFKNDGTFEFDTAVQLRGTLNNWSDKDQGWSVEGRIAWKDFARTGGPPKPDERWTFALCRYDFSVDFEGPALSTSAPLKTNPYPNFHFFEDYAGIRFVAPLNSPRAKNAPAIGIKQLPQLTTSRVLGSPDPPYPFTVERIFEKLPIQFPVTLARQPGSNWVWVVTQPWSYQPTTLSRFANQPGVNKLETLLSVAGDSLMYDLAFHPNFEENGYVFIGSNGSYGHTKKRSRVTRYRVLPDGIDADSATVIIEWESDGHNGAALTFGKDGLLYVTSGDGTSDSDTNLRGQDLTELTCKVLRIDVDNPAPGKQYRVPADNPFLDRQNVRPETWCYGLRNPWRIASDPITGHIWVGNNGQDLWEQVYLIERGANYGWSIVEGSQPFYPDRQRGPDPIQKPTVDHPHSEARSLTGGVVYHGKNPMLAKLTGTYLYGDYSTGKIWAIKHDGSHITWQQEIADTLLAITAFAHGSNDEIWLLDHQGHGIYRLMPTPADAPQHNFPRKLSESGLFANVARHQMAPGVVPYSVNSPLWSDGTYKVRYFAIPHHEQDERKIGYTATGGWHFPNESVLIKSFALETVAGDPNSRKWIETRFMVRQQNEWAGYSYRWNAEGTDAELVEAAGKDEDFVIQDATAPGGKRTQRWHYPSRAECMVCHSRAANYTLGLQTAQMNRDHDYDGVVAHQLRTLEHLQLLNLNTQGDVHQHIRQYIDADLAKQREQARDDQQVLADLQRVAQETFHKQTATRDQRSWPAPTTLFFYDPANLPRLADPYDEAQPLAERARSYLHSNCAHCHVKAGGGNANIDLAWTTPLAGTALWDVRPSHHTFGLPDARLIAPGHPDRSVLLHRVRMRGPGQMPQLATSELDRQAVEMLRRWIATGEQTIQPAHANATK